MRRPFYGNCVSWDPRLLGVLHLLVDDSEEITCAEFQGLVDRQEFALLEQSLGYDRHFPIENDYHVRYCLHRESGIPYMVHSATEIVFATDEEIEELMISIEGATPRSSDEYNPGMTM